MKLFIMLLFVVLVFSCETATAQVIQVNVMTGEVTERSYTQKELDNIEASIIADAPRKALVDKETDITTKREAAIEELLMRETSIKAKAYQDAIKE